MRENSTANTITGFLENRWFLPALITFLWVAAAFIVDPRGEFPLNDDWAYAKNVRSLVVEGKFTVDHWPAMTLVSQTFYGALCTYVFGFSFTCLRLSMLVLAWLSTLVLFVMLRKRSGAPYLSFLLSAGFSFSLLFVALAFSFMTDVFFVSFCIFSFYQLLAYIENGRTVNYILFIVFCVIAVLNRQHGFLLPVMIIIPQLWKKKLTIKKIFLSVVPLLVCLACHYTYYRILSEKHIFINSWELSKLIEAFGNKTPGELALHAGRLVLEGGLILIPAGFIFWFTDKKFNRRFFVFFLVTVIVLGAVSAEAFRAFPMGNVLSRSGVGPMMLKDSWDFNKPSFQIPAAALTVVKVISFLATCTLLSFLFKRKETPVPYTKLTGFNWSLNLFLIVYVVFSIANVSYIDRYVLPFSLVFLLAVCKQQETVSKAGYIIGSLIVAFVFSISLLAEKDFMEWQRTRWKAIEFLHAQGKNPSQIDGGFEYGGWYQPGRGFYDETDSRSWWWVDQDEYIIGLADQPGYKKIKFFTYKRNFPPVPDTVFIMEKLPLVKDTVRNEKAE